MSYRYVIAFHGEPRNISFSRPEHSLTEIRVRLIHILMERATFAALAALREPRSVERNRLQEDAKNLADSAMRVGNASLDEYLKGASNQYFYIERV